MSKYLYRYVIDDQYTSNGGAKFPIKWSPPEVLNYTRFSSKSDVWAFGVLCWEVFTCGDMPYGRAKNPEVVERVQRGQILQKPHACPFEVYEVSQDATSRICRDKGFMRVVVSDHASLLVAERRRSSVVPGAERGALRHRAHSPDGLEPTLFPPSLKNFV
jgi:serine/threonine protein kinase